MLNIYTIFLEKGIYTTQISYIYDYLWMIDRQHLNGLAQDCSNPVSNTLELLESCANPVLWKYQISDLADTKNWPITQNNYIFQTLATYMNFEFSLFTMLDLVYTYQIMSDATGLAMIISWEVSRSILCEFFCINFNVYWWNIDVYSLHSNLVNKRSIRSSILTIAILCLM